MINIGQIQNNKIDLLKKWRDRYSPTEYPYKVVMNMFYELFSDELIWNDIDTAFYRKEKIFSSYDQALEHVYMMKRDVQINSVNPNLETTLMPSNKAAAGARFSDFEDNIARAKNYEDNEAVVEIEYSYWYFCQYHDAFLHWAACAFLGMDKHEAFIEVTGGDIGDLNLSSLEGTISSLSMILGASIGASFQDYEGNSVNPKQNQNIKYYPESFQILPFLFESNNSSSNTSSNTGCLLIFVPFIIFYFLL